MKLIPLITLFSFTAHAALITNGGFEQAATGAAVGWQGGGVICGSDPHRDWIFPAHSGNCEGIAAGAMTQQIMTAPNALYTLDFWWEMTPLGGMTSLTASWDGVTVFSDSNERGITPWAHVVIQDLAGSPDPITLRFFGYGGDGLREVRLDDVQVAMQVSTKFEQPRSVPEPNSFGLVMGWLILVFLCLPRRAK